MAHDTAPSNQPVHGTRETRPWHVRLPERLQEDMKLLKGHPHYSRLICRPDPTGRMIWRGCLTVTSLSGIPRPIPIELRYRDDYPDSLPVVVDISRRFRTGLDRHILEDWSFCLTLPERRELDLRSKHTIVDFLDEVAVFLGKQLVSEALGLSRLPGPDEPHGMQAIEKLCHERLFGSDDADARLKLRRFLPHVSIARNAACPCGSGKRFRKCHSVYVKLLRSMLGDRIGQLSGQSVPA